jgi:EAL domain-containing protein (putative c-di-GMP-specific phosphodiesterase class I)
MLIQLDDLRKALTRNEIIPHFQPLVELRTGRFTGFEVLARWDHPFHGAFLPGNLIGLAEENELIGEVSRQVFTKAFAAVLKYPDGARLSVNLSPLQLSNPLLDLEI